MIDPEEEEFLDDQMLQKSLGGYGEDINAVRATLIHKYESQPLGAPVTSEHPAHWDMMQFTEQLDQYEGAYAIRKHLEGCESCRKLIVSLLKAAINIDEVPTEQPEAEAGYGPEDIAADMGDDEPIEEDQYEIGLRSVSGETIKSEPKEIKISNTLSALELTTPEEVMRYSKGTRWCLADRKHAELYLRQGPLYLFLDRGMPGDKRIAMWSPEYDNLVALNDRQMGPEDLDEIPQGQDIRDFMVDKGYPNLAFSKKRPKRKPEE